jgi:hypothetical protein
MQVRWREEVVGVEGTRKSRRKPEKAGDKSSKLLIMLWMINAGKLS